MPAGELIGLLIIGLVAGVMSGMFGIGGGAIIVPSLVIFLGYSQVKANGTSLAALLLPVAIFAVISYHRAGKLKLRAAGMIGLGLAIGAWFGAVVALSLDKSTLSVLYGLFLWYMAWRYISPRLWWSEYRGIKAEEVIEDAQVDEKNPRILMICLMIGVLAGVLSGMFGIGGGIVIGAALTGLMGFDQKLANGTSLGALLLPVGLPAVLEYYSQGQLDLPVAVPLALMLIVGSIIGARAALGLPAKAVRRLYGIFLLVIGFRFLFF